MCRVVDDAHHFVVRLTLGRFHAEHDAVALVDHQGFCSALRELEASRSGHVVLRGTDDVEIALQPDGSSGAMELRVVLVRHFTASASRSGTDLPARLSLEGRFSVPGEVVSRAVRDFEALFADAGPSDRSDGHVTATGDRSP